MLHSSIFKILLKMDECSTIIVVPHVCVLPRSMDNGCDHRSRRFAEIISSEISHSKLFIGDVARMKTDLNREEGKNTGMRRNLSAYMLKCSNNGSNSTVIDVHTFPRLGFDGFQNVQVLLIYERDSKLARLILRTLKKETKLRVEMVLGDGNNDIIIQAEKLNIQAVLIELINTMDVNDVKNIARIIRTII